MAILLALAVGLLLLPVLPVLPPYWLTVLPGLVLLWLAVRRPGARPWCWPLAAFLLAFSWSVQQAAEALAARLPAAWEGQSVTAEGWVTGLPETATHGLRLRFLPRVLRRDSGEVWPARAELQLFAPTDASLVPGAFCQLDLRLKRPHGAANPGGFDYERWLHAEGVMATGSVRQLSCTPPARAGVDMRRWQLRQLFKAEFPEQAEAGVLLALITGDRDAIPPATWERFVDTGVVHLMAISGLHITMLAALAAWLALVCLRRWPRLALHWPLHKPALLVGLLVATAYSLMAGFSVPTQRTLIMLTVAVLTVCLQRRLPALVILLLALVAVLLWSPLAVHAAGFWLSFGAVALLLLLGQAGSHRPLWRQALLLQLGMSVLLLPLTLWFFERVSWVAPVGNLLAIPLVTFLVVPLGLLGLLIWLLGWSAASLLIWRLAMGVLELLDAGLQQIAEWPAASIDWGLQGLWSFLLLSLALFCLLQPWRWSLRWLALPLGLPLLFNAPVLAEGELQVTVLDVGQGLSVWVQTRHQQLLYDTGPVQGEYSDAGRRFILPALHHEGVHALDRLVLSHDDNDHTGGAASLLRRMPVASVRGVRLRTSGPWPRDWRPCRAGEHWLADGWRFEFLYPDEADWQEMARDNNRSCVLRISRADLAILLPGDLEAAGEARLLTRLPASALRADVLVLGHHGSRHSSSVEWLAAVRPRVAIVSAGYRNAFRHPSPVLLARLQQAGIAWWNTADSGAIRWQWRPGAAPVLTCFRAQSQRYWQTREPAAVFWD